MLCDNLQYTMSKIEQANDENSFEIIDKEHKADASIIETLSEIKAKEYVIKNWNLDDTFELTGSYFKFYLENFVSEYLVDKNIEQFYIDFPIFDYLINGTNITTFFNEKIKIGTYDDTTVENINFLHSLNDNEYNNCVVKSCIMLSIFNYVSCNYSFCVNDINFKLAFKWKLISCTTKKLDSILISYVAEKFGNKNICKLWLDQIN